MKAILIFILMLANVLAKGQINLPYPPISEDMKGNLPENWVQTRNEKTQLYFIWLDILFQTGFDIHFDKNAPENQAFIWSVDVATTSENVRAFFEKKRLRNSFLSRQQNQWHEFENGMEMFRCFYKYAYQAQGTKFRVLKMQLKEYGKREKLSNTKLMIRLFKKESKKAGCWFDDLWPD